LFLFAEPADLESVFVKGPMPKPRAQSPEDSESDTKTTGKTALLSYQTIFAIRDTYNQIREQFLGSRLTCPTTSGMDNKV